MTKALITGITGQDGSYLTEMLLHKGYEVHGIIRRSSTFNTNRLDHIYRDPHNGEEVKLYLHYGTRFYQASTSELFGNAAPPQSETTKFQPQSPYGAAKLYAFWVTRNYSQGYGMFACNGILFNHESPRRGETFVTRKLLLPEKSLVLSPASKLANRKTSSSVTWTQKETGVMHQNTLKRCGLCSNRINRMISLSALEKHIL